MKPLLEHSASNYFALHQVFKLSITRASSESSLTMRSAASHVNEKPADLVNAIVEILTGEHEGRSGQVSGLGLLAVAYRGPLE